MAPDESLGHAFNSNESVSGECNDDRSHEDASNIVTTSEGHPLINSGHVVAYALTSCQEPEARAGPIHDIPSSSSSSLFSSEEL